MSVLLGLWSSLRALRIVNKVHIAPLRICSQPYQWTSIRATLDPTATSKVCSACDATVERKKCHKNRYGEYICRSCLAGGTRSTWRGQLRHFGRWVLPAFLATLAISCIAYMAWWPSLLGLN